MPRRRGVAQNDSRVVRVVWAGPAGDLRDAALVKHEVAEGGKNNWFHGVLSGWVNRHWQARRLDGVDSGADCAELLRLSAEVILSKLIN
jgi:predicted nucleic acid-binding Zn ribbon protein